MFDKDETTNGQMGVMVVILLGLPCITLAQKQKVTINVKEVDVQIVFKQIKEQTNLNFVYNAGPVESDEKRDFERSECLGGCRFGKAVRGFPFRV